MIPAIKERQEVRAGQHGETRPYKPYKAVPARFWNMKAKKNGDTKRNG